MHFNLVAYCQISFVRLLLKEILAMEKGMLSSITVPQ